MKAEVKAHSQFGASSAHRWTACPGSVRLCASVPNVSSVYAAEGTAAHALAEHCLRQLDAAANYVGETFEGFKVTVEMAEAVQVYLSHVESVFREAEGDELNVEERFTLSHIADDCFGTNDCSIYKPSTGVLHVMDYKHGVGYAVEVENNPQLLYYALGAATRHGNRPISKVVLTVVQPRCPHPSGSVRTVEVDAVTLLEWGEDLRDAVDAARKPDAPLVSGTQCKFCPAAGSCPALHEKAIAAATNEFGLIGATSTIPTLSPVQIRDRLVNASLIEIWIKAIRAHAYNEARAGRMPDGFKFVAKVARRKWLNSENAMLRLESLGVNLHDVTQLKTPAQVEKAVGKDVYGHLVEEVIQESGGVNLVSLSHKGAAVSPDAAGDFGDVEFED